MIRKILIMSIGITLLAQNLYSDDSYVKVLSGSVKLISSHPSIRMTGENIKIIINSTDTYDVNATFMFYNEAQSTTVLVGFPMKGWSPEDRLTGEFHSFKTFVNGKEVNVINQYKNFEGEMPMDEKWKVKEVYFSQGQETVTHVQYTAPYGHVSDGSTFIDYIIGTGASWHGNIGISTFTVIFPDDIDLSLTNDTPFQRGSVLSGRCEFMRTRNTMTWRTPEFKPGTQDAFSIYINPHSQPWNDPEQDAFEYTSEPVDIRLLEKLSLKQLKIFRNEIFARHGRIFKDKMLEKHFSLQKWYKQTPDFKELELNTIERENIKIISDYERKLINER